MQRVFKCERVSGVIASIKSLIGHLFVTDLIKKLRVFKFFCRDKILQNEDKHES